MPYLPVPAPEIEGDWRRDAAAFPRPLTPFTAAWLLPTLNAGTRQALQDLGCLIDRIELREIDGYVYACLAPFGRQRQARPLALPFVRLLVRIAPKTRRRLNLAARAWRSGAYAESLGQWRREWRPALRTRLATLRTATPSSLSAGDLDAHVEQALRLGQDGLRAYARVQVAALMALGGRLAK